MSRSSEFNLFQDSLAPLRPPLWARDGHTQTLAGFLIPSSNPSDLGEKVLFPLEDGDQLVAYLDAHDSDEIYVFFHGLGGCVRSNYMLRSRDLMKKRRKTSLLVNHRQAGEGYSLAKGIYHSGKTSDVSEVIGALRKRFGAHKKIIAVGFSLSANILLLLNGRDHHLNQADGYISANGPIDLLHCAEALRRGFNKVYDQYFIKILNPLLPLELRQDPRIKTLWDFDEIWTSKQAGFRSREEYYRECSASPYLNRLEKPHVILTAKDDPFILFDDYLRADYSKVASPHFSEVGGHLGYFSKSATPIGSRRWLDYFLLKSAEAFELSL